MAKYRVEFENGEIKKTLNILNEEFQYTMKPYQLGLKGDKPCFLSQVEKDFPEWVEDEDIYEALDGLDCVDEEEVLKTLKLLNNFEIEVRKLGWGIDG